MSETSGTPFFEPTQSFLRARDFLLAHRDDYDTAYDGFVWPSFETFNWAWDWFDSLAVSQAAVPALRFVEADGSEESVSYQQMSDRSRRSAAWLGELGLVRGDRVLLFLGNCVPLWELMLACIRLGVVMIPATTLLSAADVRDRITRGQVRAIVAAEADIAKIGDEGADCVRVVLGDAPGWRSYADAADCEPMTERVDTGPDETLLLYFTSGTTAQPKLVEHSHTSYPVGHLATMYWIGLHPGDVHLNVSSPGWAKHAWSCFFAPWNAGATIAIYNFERFDAAAMLDQIVRLGVTTFCAPPTVWRMLIQQDLASYPVVLREVIGAGEPLNPEIIQRVGDAWHLPLRDGFGQTETTAQVGNTPNQTLKPGSMGRALPGYVIRLVDPVDGHVVMDGHVGEGEICIELAKRPTGLMTGYAGDDERTSEAVRSGFYHTGDVASIDEEGYITYVGRADDVFKASDYRISPFELESVLLEHPAVGEAAVVPSPDPVRLAVPKAFVVCAQGYAPSRELAGEILAYAREHLSPFKRIRRLEFADLPKTVSGKIRRVELRTNEAAGEHGALAFSEDDFSTTAAEGR